MGGVAGSVSRFLGCKSGERAPGQPQVLEGQSDQGAGGPKQRKTTSTTRAKSGTRRAVRCDSGDNAEQCWERGVMGRASELPGPGSYRLLCWVARLGIAGIEPTRLVLGVSQAVAYSHVARLVDAGLLWRAWVNDGGGGVVAVTRAGAREARERETIGVVMPRSAAPRSARHGRAVSWAAAAAE